MKLRVDVHAHTNLDPHDGIAVGGFLEYSYQDALLAAKRAKIDVLSFTHHRKLIFTQKMASDAKKLGITLIPGVEAVIDGADVLLLNPTTDNITTFIQLAAERQKNKSLVVIAPHPFYPASQSLGFKLLRHIELFDAIEYCHFHTPWFNVFNGLAVFVARRHTLSVVGTSDSHSLDGFGLTYAVVSSKSKTRTDILFALKQPSRVRVETKVVPCAYFVRVIRGMAGYHLKRVFKRRS